MKKSAKKSCQPKGNKETHSAYGSSRLHLNHSFHFFKGLQFCYTYLKIIEEATKFHPTRGFSPCCALSTVSQIQTGATVYLDGEIHEFAK
jgi:hypothetical protein